MVHEKLFKREDKEYLAKVGVTPQGESVCYFETVLPEGRLELRYRWEFLDLSVKANRAKRMGSINYIRTDWRKTPINANGEYIDGESEDTYMYTNFADIIFFCMGFGEPMLMSILNGAVRGCLGFNALPVFDVIAKTAKVYTPWQEALPPTNDYDTVFSPILPEEPIEDGPINN